MTPTETMGYAGAVLAGAAYFPQIRHMVVERCVEGISRAAFGLWALASALLLARAVAVSDPVFVSLGVIQVAATGFVVAYVTALGERRCPSHAPPGRRGG